MSTESGVPPEAVEAGSTALTQGGLETNRPVGDVLHDYDWTPHEAATVVLAAALPHIEAAVRQRTVDEIVEALDKSGDYYLEGAAGWVRERFGGGER